MLDYYWLSVILGAAGLAGLFLTIVSCFVRTDDENKVKTSPLGFIVIVISVILLSVAIMLLPWTDSASSSPPAASGGEGPSGQPSESASVSGAPESASMPASEPLPAPTGTESDPDAPGQTAFSIEISYETNLTQISQSGIDVLITVKSSLPATTMVLYSSTDEEDYGPFSMHSGEDNQTWWFNANFYKHGNYTVTVEAYSADGQTVSGQFTYVY